MHEFTPAAGAAKAVLYADLVAAVDAITDGETDPVANMANAAALFWQFLPHVNWTGFYRVVDGELILGPFMGKPACLRIAFGQGVCGTAAANGRTHIVPDVHQFPGHIACDADSRSELVVPIIRDGRVVAVIDLDSPHTNRFDSEDAAGIEGVAALLASRI